MRTAIECSSHAEECRRLAKDSPRAEDWGHFLEMAETWELLSKHRQDRARRQTIALADRFRNVLFLSDPAPMKKPAMEQVVGFQASAELRWSEQMHATRT
jgi:hypothetical protein